MYPMGLPGTSREPCAEALVSRLLWVCGTHTGERRKPRAARMDLIHLHSTSVQNTKSHRLQLHKAQQAPGSQGAQKTEQHTLPLRHTDLPAHPP